MNKLLLVEDDKKLSTLIFEYLRNHGFSIECESRGDRAVYRILQEPFTLVILDVNLPGLNGLQVCKMVRNQYDGFILILTAREADEDQILGLQYGADDYVHKPLQPKVLLARIEALLRRPKTPIKNIAQLNFGKLTIDLVKQQVFLNKKLIELKPSEFNLLKLLVMNAGTPLSRNTIMQTLRGIDYDGIDRTIDLRISYLRNKLADNIENPYKIKTIRNQGYVFIADAWD